MTRIMILVGVFPREEWKEVQYTNDFGEMFTKHRWHFVGISKYGDFVLERDSQFNRVRLEEVD